ncbi:MAG: UDP-2,3-diacylglucosamine diphosphatase LpxI, partial [Holosporales bacterium]|nr:UDP-2,3-diacylglucosamine diphosphatase LpxI [Holosporales bacterium]
HDSFKIGEVGKILGFIKNSKASKVLFCGGIKRPSLLSLKLDSLGQKWLRYLGLRAFLGDDTFLKGIKKLLENEGLTVVSPQSVLETLLTPCGILTKSRPNDIDLQDIARGMFVLNTLSKTDIGQAVIVQEGIVLGLEAAEGTSALIKRCLGLKISKNGGVLIKTSKLNQDKTMDFPTIGKDTIIEAHMAKLSGLAIGAGQSQIIDFEGTVKLADKYELFIIGV